MIKKERIGTYIKGSAIGGEFYQAYLPPPLPPAPPLNMEILYPFLDQAIACYTVDRHPPISLLEKAGAGGIV